ncbi:MAG: hypothetical protein AAFR56_19810, partial [Chloroflexota bacterium]
VYLDSPLPPKIVGLLSELQVEIFDLHANMVKYRLQLLKAIEAPETDDRSHMLKWWKKYAGKQHNDIKKKIKELDGRLNKERGKLDGPPTRETAKAAADKNATNGTGRQSTHKQQDETFPSRENQRKETSSALNAVKVYRIVNLWDAVSESPLLDMNTEQEKKEGIQKDDVVPLKARLKGVNESHFDFVVSNLRQMNYQIVLFVAPTEISTWMLQSREGYSLPFHDFYKLKLPDLRERMQFLRQLAYAPNLLEGGLIDVEKGIIYRYPTEPRERRVSWLTIIVALVVSTLMAMSFPYINQMVNATAASQLDTSVARAAINWLVMISGVVIHVFVHFTKLEKPPIVSTGEVNLFLMARSFRLLVQMLTMALAFILYSVALNGAETYSYFLFGYSLDSFIGLFTEVMRKRTNDTLERIRTLDGTV